MVGKFAKKLLKAVLPHGVVVFLLHRKQVRAARNVKEVRIDAARKAAVLEDCEQALKEASKTATLGSAR